MIEIFNNREKASATLILLFFAYAFLDKKVRDSFGQVLSFLKDFKFMTSVIVILLYFCAVLKLLSYWYGLQIGFIKDSLLWLFFAEFSTIMNLSKVKDGRVLYGKIISENIQFVLLLEFIVNVYSFSYIIELFFQFILALVVLLKFMSEKEQKTKNVANLMNIALIFLVSIVIVSTVRQIWQDSQSFFSIDNLKSVVLTPILSLLFIPFLYCLLLWHSYENLFSIIEFRKEKNSEVVKYAKKTFLFHAKFGLKNIGTLLTEKRSRLWEISTKNDVDEIIKEVSF